MVLTLAMRNIAIGQSRPAGVFRDAATNATGAFPRRNRCAQTPSVSVCIIRRPSSVIEPDRDGYTLNV